METNSRYIVLPTMTVSHDLLRLKLAESLAAEPPALTRRDVHLPAIPGKPERYLLNAGGRPKLFKEIARVKDTDWAAFMTR